MRPSFISDRHKEKALFILALLFIFSIGVAVQFHNHHKYREYVTASNIQKKQTKISLDLVVLINQIDRNLMSQKNSLTFETGKKEGVGQQEQLKQRLITTREKAVAVMQYLQKHEHNLTPETLFEANNMLESIKDDYYDIKLQLDHKLENLNNS